MQNKLPQFEANQVLSNVHLNQFVEYLEEQGRLTRNHLLGAGIVSGLEIKRNSATTISIYEGAGLTSAGYLVIPDTPNWSGTDAGGKRFITYNRKKKFELKNILPAYKGEFEKAEDNYEIFNSIKDNLFVLIEAADNSTDTTISNLAQADLDEHVIVLYLEVKVKELKNCEGADCINLGRMISYNVHPLLLTKADATIVLAEETKAGAATDSTTLINNAAGLPDITLQKLDLTLVDNVISTDKLVSVYGDVLKQLSKDLDSKHQKIDTTLKNIIGTAKNPVADFKNKLNELSSKVEFFQSPGHYQYFYDFACDFAASYRELQDAVHEFVSYDIRPQSSFPCHIRLGQVPSSTGSVTNAFQIPFSELRHSFITSRNVEGQREVYHKLQSLFNRLAGLTENFVTDSNKEDIRITPSIEPGNSLSEKAIPFYYKKDNNKKPLLLPHWNFEFYSKGKLNRIQNYFTNANKSARSEFADGKKPGVDDALHFPLLYQHEASNFYRVEGYLGLQYPQIFESLYTYMQNYNLPFDLQLVGLNKDTQMVMKEVRLKFNDLDSMYNVMTEEVLCLLKTEMNYFGNIRLTRLLYEVNFTEEVFIKEPKDDVMVMLNEDSDSSFFYREYGKSRKMQMKGISRKGDIKNLGVADSTVDMVQKTGTRIPTKDLTNMLGVRFPGKVSTPASPYILKLIAAIDKLIQSLKDDFADFIVENYKENLREMHEEAKRFIVYLSTQDAADLAKNSNLKRDEALGYLERLLYECDFEKIWVIDEERTTRENELGFNTNLDQFLAWHPGLEHKAGVWKNGTFVIVFDQNGTAVADFCLPYRCCASANTTQFVLGVLQTLWFEGQVLDKDGAPVTNAEVLLNGQKLVIDNTGRFKRIISPNTFFVLKVSADGFEATEISFTSANDNVSQTVTLLKKAQIPKVPVTIKVVNSAGGVIAQADVKIDDVAGKTNANGEAVLQVRAGTIALLNISAGGFISIAENIDVPANAIALNYTLKKIVKLSGLITNAATGQPVLNASVFVNDKLITVNGNKYETELEDNRTYTLRAKALGLQEFVKEIVTTLADFPQPIAFEKIKTLSVRVAVYRVPETTTRPNPRLERIRELENSIREETVSGATRGRLSGPFARTRMSNPLILRRMNEDLVRERHLLATEGAAIAVSAPDKFILQDKTNVISKLAGKAQDFNQNLRMFESQEEINLHQLSITDGATTMNFNSMMNIIDHDVIVLVKSSRGATPQAQFSLVIDATGSHPGASDDIAKFNEVMSNAFGLHGTQPIVTGKKVDLRLFNESDKNEIVALLNKNGIIALARNI